MVTPFYYDEFKLNRGLYGLESECGGLAYTCVSEVVLYTDNANNPTMAPQRHENGFAAGAFDPLAINVTQTYQPNGSMLVRASVVPVPAAAWLFGSGLIGLIGIARHKQSV